MKNPFILYILARQRLLTVILLLANAINIALIISFGLWFWGACVPMLTLAAVIGYQAHIMRLRSLMWKTISQFIEHNDEGGTIPDTQFFAISEVVRLWPWSWRRMKLSKEPLPNNAGFLYLEWASSDNALIWSVSSCNPMTDWVVKTTSEKLLRICHR